MSLVITRWILFLRKRVDMKVIDTVKEFSFIELLIFFMIAICVVALVLSLTTETITLRKSEWLCSKRKIVQSPQLIGKVMVQTSNSQCIEYTKKEV